MKHKTPTFLITLSPNQVAMEFPELWPGFTYLPHQKAGIKWMLNREKDGTTLNFGDDEKDTVCVLGGIQADEMGLGKTIQMVATMRANVKSRTLVLLPVAILETWIGVLVRAGFQVYHPHRRSSSSALLWSLHPSCSRATIIPGAGMVFVANYEKTTRNPSLFTKPYGRLIIDEAHKIANEGRAISLAIQRIVAPIRWALTGTPIINSWGDLRSLVRFVGVPDEILPGATAIARSEEYLYKISTLVIHRTMDDERGNIASAPPPPVIHKKVLEFSTDEEAKFYRGVQGAIESALDDSNSPDMDMPGWKLQLYMRLRQISIHPQVYINARRRSKSGYSRRDWEYGSTKFDALARIIREDRAESTRLGNKMPKYLVFCQFSDEIDLLQTFLSGLDGLGLKVAKFEGGMTEKERVRALDYAKTKADCFLIQLQAGGCGLNLQEFNRVVFMGPWWTQALMDQAIARAVRIGQRDIVRVYYLVLAEEKTLNIDLEILKKAQLKKEMLDRFFSHVQ